MQTARFNRRIPLVAGIVLLLLVALWHSKPALSDHAASAFKGIHGTLTKRPTLYEIALKHGTDKVTTHSYQYMYDSRLEPLRDRPLKMLEIGLGCDMSYGPGASYYTWLEYFSHVDLYYIEYNAVCATAWANKTTGATVFAGDQADVAFLRRFVEKSGGGFDVIIDDGGHSMMQQKTSLEHLWDAVKPGGIYFVEDLDTSYMERYGGGIGKTDTFMEDVKSMLDDMNKHAGVPDKSRISKDVVKLDFVQEVVALTKRDPSKVGGI